MVQMKSKELFPVVDRSNRVTTLLKAVPALEAAEAQIVTQADTIETLRAQLATHKAELDKALMEINDLNDYTANLEATIQNLEAPKQATKSPAATQAAPAPVKVEDDSTDEEGEAVVDEALTDDSTDK